MVSEERPCESDDQDQFDYLVAQLLDDEISESELEQLISIVNATPARRQALQSQMEAAEFIAQAEDELRQSALFVSTVVSRTADDPFVDRLRSRLDQAGHDASKDSKPWRRFPKLPWSVAAVMTLAFLLAIYLIRPQAEKTIATITAVSGAAQWTGAGGQVDLDLVVGQKLSGGTLESLATDSWVTLEFVDGSTLTLTGRSVLTVSASEGKELHLREGDLSANVEPQSTGHPMVIHTPTALLEVVGTQFNVDAEQSSTVLNVNEGVVRVTRLSDGKTVEVAKDNQVVASASMANEFKVMPQRQPVQGWRSQLPLGVVYGQWNPDVPGVSAKSHLWRGCEEAKRDPILLYVASLSVSRGDQPPVVLQPNGKFRILGRLEQPKNLIIGLTTQRIKGGFAGKYKASRRAEEIVLEDGEFELLIDVEEFKPEKSEYPASPIGLRLHRWWCLTVKEDAGLTISSVELLQNSE